MESAESLADKVSQQSALVNKLRLENAEASVLDDARKALGALKKSLGQAKAAEAPKNEDGGKKKEEQKLLLLKTAKVCRPFKPCWCFCEFVSVVREHGTTIQRKCIADEILNVSWKKSLLHTAEDVLTHLSLSGRMY